VELTEAETEYAINVVKHIYDRQIVLQYNCTNTIQEQLLEDVRIYIFLRFKCQLTEVLANASVSSRLLFMLMPQMLRSFQKFVRSL
jgi:hypothetical protein